MSDISQGYQDDSDGAADPLREGARAAREAAGETLETVKAEAAHFADAAREKAVEQVESRKDAVTSAVSDFADAMRKAGEELSQKDQTMAGRLASQAADGLQSLARSVSEKSPEDMLNAARRFGRENPTAFLAGAVLAGLALGRFARSSAEHTTQVQTPTAPPERSAGGGAAVSRAVPDEPVGNGMPAQGDDGMDDWNAPPMGSLS